MSASRLIRRPKLVSHRHNQYVVFGKLMPQTEIQREHVAGEVHSRFVMQFCHQHCWFGDVKPADDSIETIRFDRRCSLADRTRHPRAIGPKFFEAEMEFESVCHVPREPRRTEDCATLKIMRGNIDMSKLLRCFIEKAPFYRGFSPANPADQPVTAAFQDTGDVLQCKLDVLAHAIIQIDLWRVDRGLIRAMFEYDRKIVFPFTVSRGAGIISDHRRSALAKSAIRADGCDQDRNLLIVAHANVSRIQLDRKREA